MIQTLRIYLIEPLDIQAGSMAIRLQSKGFQVSAINSPESLLGVAYSDPPDIIIADLSEQTPSILSMIHKIKGDCYFNAIPVIGIIEEVTANKFDWENIPVDDFIFLPISYPELFTRIELSMQRMRRVFDNNPLTRLPGNTSIQHAIEAVIGQPMSVCYVDINHFKPYNDIYGFSHGDEVLRMLARIMFNEVKIQGGGFTGHIGGDDFVFIVPIERAEQVSQAIIDNFSSIISDLFGEQEKKCGYYMGKNRRGQDEQIPLLGISIAIVNLDSPSIRHYGKVAEVAAELKSSAKNRGGSCFVHDRRN